MVVKWRNLGFACPGIERVGEIPRSMVHATPPKLPPSATVSDACRVSRRPMPAGRIPVVGMGTFGSDHASGDALAEAVLGAAAVGYRHFDCASVYGNEGKIGHSLRQVMASGVPRSELWINSKVWNDRHSPDAVIDSCRRSLEDLGLDHLDLYLVHWPFPNFHPPGCSVESRSPNSRPYIHAEFLRTWEAMERLLGLGLVRNI